MSIDGIKHIAVVGEGYMGGGIAQTCAARGYQVSIADVDAASAQKSRDRLHTGRAIEARNPRPASRRLRGGHQGQPARGQSMESASADADYIFEAVPEVESIKLVFYKGFQVPTRRQSSAPTRRPSRSIR